MALGYSRSVNCTLQEGLELVIAIVIDRQYCCRDTAVVGDKKKKKKKWMGIHHSPVIESVGHYRLVLQSQSNYQNQLRFALQRS